MAKHIQFDDYGTGHNANCVACEELFADALDNVLSTGDQVFFEQHLQTCASCSESFAQAQRGAAWLELLKSPRPQPSETLVKRILSQTLDSDRAGDPHHTAIGEVPLITAIPDLPHNVIAFAPRPISRITRFTRIAMEPRLAMTAAMAFFSIALTLNLLGVRLDQIKAADLSPTNLKQTYFQANATAVRYYDNLKVVRVLESRVDDMRQSNAVDELPAQPERKQQPEEAPTAKPQQTPKGSSRREGPLHVAPRTLNTEFQVSTDLSRRPAASANAYRLKQGGGLV